MSLKAIAFASATFAVAAAQDVSAQAGRFSLDGSAGLTRVVRTGDVRDGRVGLAADLVGAATLTPGAGAGMVGGLNMAFSTGSPVADCGSQTDPVATGCPSQPEFTVYSGLIGWQNESRELRFMAGPGVARAHGSNMLALHTRVDHGVHLWRRLAFLTSIRSTVVPDYRDDRFLLLAATVGLRVSAR